LGRKEAGAGLPGPGRGAVGRRQGAGSDLRGVDPHRGDGAAREGARREGGGGGAADEEASEPRGESEHLVEREADKVWLHPASPRQVQRRAPRELRRVKQDQPAPAARAARAARAAPERLHARDPRKVCLFPREVALPREREQVQRLLCLLLRCVPRRRALLCRRAAALQRGAGDERPACEAGLNVGGGERDEGRARARGVRA